VHQVRSRSVDDRIVTEIFPETSIGRNVKSRLAVMRRMTGIVYKATNQVCQDGLKAEPYCMSSKFFMRESVSTSRECSLLGKIRRMKSA
jgi:hypothetical protein